MVANTRAMVRPWTACWRLRVYSDLMRGWSEHGRAAPRLRFHGCYVVSTIRADLAIELVSRDRPRLGPMTRDVSLAQTSGFRRYVLKI